MTDGLLLLLKAAEKLNEVDFAEKSHHDNNWELRSNNYLIPTLPSACVNHNRTSSNRCSHNELEKSRRAHLRTCMEALKERLIFENDVPRITMLTVLKKATATIQLLRQRNQYLEACEDNEKQKCAQLLKRRQALRKSLEEKRCRAIKIMNWRERNRNYSESSRLTSSSEEPELGHNIHHASETKFINPHQVHTPKSSKEFIDRDLNCITTLKYSVSSSRKLSLSPGELASPPSGMDVYDASSSDSGFEEVIITCGEQIPKETQSGILKSSYDGAYGDIFYEAC